MPSPHLRLTFQRYGCIITSTLQNVWRAKMSRVKDITGQKFNRLTVVSRAENSRHGNAMWNCLCDCGNMTVVLGSNLRNGEVKSCGCLLAEKNKARSTHGMTRTKLYQTWVNMRRRCTDPKSKSYKDYGMRGIYVCDFPRLGYFTRIFRRSKH